MNSSSPQVDSYSRSRISGGSTPTPIGQPGFAPIDGLGGSYLYVKQTPQNYTDMQTNSSPYRQGHLISQNKNAPEGYICVGKVLDSEHKSIQVSTNNPKKFMFKYAERTSNGPLDLTKQYYAYSGTPSASNEFPPSFNPRIASNMPVREKVMNWIQKVPAIDHSERGNSFVQCYPGVVSSSSESGDEIVDNSEAQDIIELQARRITQYVTRIYKNEVETIAHYDTSDIEYDLNLALEAEDLMHLEHSVDNYLDGLTGRRLASQDHSWKVNIK